MTLFSLEASHNYANLTHQQENDLERKMTATSGRKCLEQFEKFNRVGSWAKTFADLLIGMEGWYSMKCKLTWKLKATKLHRFYFQLVPSTHHIEEIEFGLLPTPTCMDQTNATATMKSTQVKEGSMHSVTLTRAMAMGMLPTPNASHFNARGNQPNWDGSDLVSTMHKMTNQTGSTSHLSPQFVLEMMGFPTDWTLLPFLNGETNQSKQEEMQ